MIHIRPLNPNIPTEVALVASRMRQTLIEVLGSERGEEMYTMPWLENRVRQHLDPAQITGQVYLAQDENSQIIGHTIVRIDQDEGENPIGLFSTTYVTPDARRSGVASQLLQQGETWMAQHNLPIAVTYTDKDNHKLQKLYQQYGYQLTPMTNDFVKLAKPLPTK